MSQLIQLVYISRANFQPGPAEAGVEPVVARILQQSRTNNPKRGIGGVLYYGDGCFFQCLEGEQEVVLKLVEKLKRDSRHKDFRIVQKGPVTARHFSDWSMKYIPVSDAVKSLLESRGHKRFDPYQFDRKTHEQLLHLFRSLGDSARAEPFHPPTAPAKSPVDGLLVGTAAVVVLAVLVCWLLL